MPRQKISRKSEPKSASASAVDLTELAALPAITEQQHAYVDARLKGLSAGAAYDAAYPSRTPHGRKPTISSRRGRELNSNPNVAAWIAAGRAARASQGAYTIDAAMEQTEEARRMAARSGNAGAVVQAVKLASQLNGLLIERHEVTRFDATELVKSLARLGLGPGNELYDRLARRMDASAAPQLADATTVLANDDPVKARD